MTTMLDRSSGWQVPVRQVGQAVPLATEQPAEEPSPAAPESAPEPAPSSSPAAAPETSPYQHDQEPDPAGTDTDNVIPMHPEPEPNPADVEQEPELDSGGAQPAPPQHDPVDLDPPPEKPDDPFAGGFKLRHASLIGYCMSVGIAAIGQILALASIFGGTFVAWITAAVAAAFAEVAMVGAGSWSLELRRKGHPWRLLMVGAAAVCCYAVIVQIVHYIPEGIGQAAVFAGASAIGWTLHMTVEHVRVAAYLKDQQRYEAALAAWRERQQKQQPPRSAPSRSSKQRSSTRSGRTAGSSRTKSSGSKGKPQLSQDDVTQMVRSGQLGPKDGPAAVRKAKQSSHSLPAESTLKRWIALAREAAASA